RSLGVGERREAMIGTEDIGRAIDQIEMLLGLHPPLVAAARRGVSPHLTCREYAVNAWPGAGFGPRGIARSGSASRARAFVSGLTVKNHRATAQVGLVITVPHCFSSAVN